MLWAGLTVTYEGSDHVPQHEAAVKRKRYATDDADKYLSWGRSNQARSGVDTWLCIALV